MIHDLLGADRQGGGVDDQTVNELDHLVDGVGQDATGDDQSQVVRVLDPVEHLPHGRVVCMIAGERGYRAAKRSGFRHRLAQRAEQAGSRRDGARGDVGDSAGCGQLDRDSPADTPAGAGDQDNPAFERT